jgi:antitoxin component YwqK of YwqJK toxin-antitoxin module
MQNINILSEDEVLKKGIEFTGDLCFSGKYGQQVYNRPMEEGGEPINGLVYEKYSNGHINYYCYHENGISNGEFVDFYESTKIKKHRIMRKGQIWGESIEWFENGSVRCIEHCKYGIVISYEKWDENGNLVDKKTEPNDSEKRLLAKYEDMYGMVDGNV